MCSYDYNDRELASVYSQQNAMSGNGYGQGIMDVVEGGQEYATGAVYGVSYGVQGWFSWLVELIKSFIPDVPYVDRRLVVLIVFAILAYALWTGYQKNQDVLTKQFETIRLNITSVTPDFK